MPALPVREQAADREPIAKRLKICSMRFREIGGNGARSRQFSHPTAASRFLEWSSMNSSSPQLVSNRQSTGGLGRIPNPIRIDLWSSSDLRAFGRGLFGSDEVVLPEYVQTSNFAARIRENERAIRENYIATAETVRNRIAITPAAEWLRSIFTAWG
jgi:hypothetical protein